MIPAGEREYVLATVPGPVAMDALRAALATLDPSPVLHPEDHRLLIRYAFPDVTLAMIESTLAATPATALGRWPRWRLAVAAMREQNESELLEAVIGWRARLDHVHGLLDPAGSGSSRRQQWQDYEQRGR